MTKDLGRRLSEHRSGRGSKYVKGRLPLKLVYQEKCRAHAEALRREMEIKKLNKERKEKLITDGKDSRSR